MGPLRLLYFVFFPLLIRFLVFVYHQSNTSDSWRLFLSFWKINIHTNNPTTLSPRNNQYFSSSTLGFWNVAWPGGACLSQESGKLVVLKVGPQDQQHEHNWGKHERCQPPPQTFWIELWRWGLAGSVFRSRFRYPLKSSAHHLHIFSSFTNVCVVPCFTADLVSSTGGFLWQSAHLWAWQGRGLKGWLELVSVCVGREDAWSPWMLDWATRLAHFTEEVPVPSLWFFLLSGSESLLLEGLSLKVGAPGIYTHLHFHFPTFILV